MSVRRAFIRGSVQDRQCCASLAARPGPLRTWLSGLAVIADVQVQAGDEEVVGRFLHVKFLKILAEATAAAVALAATECLGPGLLGTGSGWSGLHVTERRLSIRGGRGGSLVDSAGCSAQVDPQHPLTGWLTPVCKHSCSTEIQDLI